MEENYTVLEEPLNITDFVVQFDPETKRPEAAKPLASEEIDENVGIESYKTDGFDMPIIRIDHFILNEKYLNSMTLRYEGFVPTLELIVDDDNNEIQYVGGPGIHNHVTVIMCPNVNGLYRSMAALFYIKDRINLTSTRIKYVCEYHNIGLSDTQCMQIGEKSLTTYEFCETIAKRLGFGFACTDHCKDISDPRWRQIYSQNVREFIEEQIKIGGLDESSVFDAWVDMYGYINLINLSWVFEQDIKPENLSIKVQKTVEVPTKDAAEAPPSEVQRTFLDVDSYPFSMLRITDKYSYLNTKNVQNLGTNSSFWCLTSPGEENKLTMQDIMIEEDTVQGKKDTQEYSFRKVEFLGCDMSEDTPYLIQSKIREHWIQKRKSKQLTIELNKPNFGLERGTLITVGIFEDEPRKKVGVTQTAENVSSENKAKENERNVVDETKPPVDMDTVSSETSFAGNPALSGIYYIDGMMFEYSKDTRKTTQILFLIKQSPDGTLLHDFGDPVKPS